MSEPVRVAPDVPLPEWARPCIDLASARLGAEVLAVSNEFFAPASRMLNPEPARFVPGLYDEHGKWMDGWESQRRRNAGHDWCILRLARTGTLFGFDADTSHFTGNYAPAIRIEASHCKGDPDTHTAWTTLLPITPLGPDAHHFLPLESRGSWTHLRVHIHPDGGLARLRVYGRPELPLLSEGEEIDLAAAINGARTLAWNDAHFGAAANLLMPGRGRDMGDGWETRRRREPGQDWCLVQLAVPGQIQRIELDTAHFKGNYPDRASLQAYRSPLVSGSALVAESLFWPELLAPQPLSADTVHHFDEIVAPLGVVSHVRLNLFPDGGLSRLRLWGAPLLMEDGR